MRNVLAVNPIKICGDQKTTIKIFCIKYPEFLSVWKEGKIFIVMVLWFGRGANGKRCINLNNAKCIVPVLQIHVLTNAIDQGLKEAW